MKCTECPWCWKNEYDSFPHCQYPYDDGFAPCEVDEFFEEPNDDECEYWDELLEFMEGSADD